MSRQQRCTTDEHTRRWSSAASVEEQTYARTAKLFMAASDPGRLRLLMTLAEGPIVVSALAERLRLRLPHVSQQLAVLRDANLVRATRRGQQVEYSLVDHHVDDLLGHTLAIGRHRP